MATQLLLIDLPPVPSAAAVATSGGAVPALGSARRRGGQPTVSRRVRSRPVGASSAGTASPSGGRHSTGAGRESAPLRRGNPAFGRLDDRTRELGLRGVEEARRALAAAIERSGRGTAA
jgi:hypothetical protein